MSEKNQDYRWILHAAFALWVLALWGVGYLNPRCLVDGLQEDGWGEWIEFYAFSLATLFFFLAFLRSRKNGADQWHQFFPLLMALGCFFITGEEISWGQRFFGWTAQEEFLKYNAQQELNLHNFLEYGYVDSSWMVAVVALGYGLGLPFLRRVACRFPAMASPAHVLPNFAHTPWYGLVALGAIFNLGSVATEMAETLLGLLFLTAALEYASAATLPPSKKQPLTLLAVWSVAIVLGILTPPILNHTLYAADAETNTFAQMELQQLAHDLPQKGNLNATYFRNLPVIHRRIFIAMQEGFIRFQNAPVRVQKPLTTPNATTTKQDALRQSYFIDPWGQAYWLWFSRKHGGILLYSFGVNRRRDTLFGLMTHEELLRAQLPGDDLGVWIDLSERLATQPTTSSGGSSK